MPPTYRGTAHGCGGSTVRCAVKMGRNLPGCGAKGNQTVPFGAFYTKQQYNNSTPGLTLFDIVTPFFLMMVNGSLGQKMLSFSVLTHLLVVCRDGWIYCCCCCSILSTDQEVGFIERSRCAQIIGGKVNFAATLGIISPPVSSSAVRTSQHKQYNGHHHHRCLISIPTGV